MKFFLLLSLISILFSCQRDDFSGMEITDGEKISSTSQGDENPGDSNNSSRLSNRVIEELQSNLSSSSVTRSSSKSSPPVNTSLNQDQVQVIADAATEAVNQSSPGKVKISSQYYQRL